MKKSLPREPGIDRPDRKRPAARQSRGVVDTSFRDLFEHNPVAMFIYDRDDHTILEGNDVAATQYGYSRAQFTTMRIGDLLLPEDRWRLAEPYMVPHNEGLAQVGLRRHRRADGTVFHVEIVRRDLSFRGRRASLVTAIDVTEKIEAARQLREKAARLARSQAHLASAQRLSRIGSDDRDLLTDEAEWSDETYSIFGVSPDEFVPTTENFLALVHPDDRGIIARSRAEIAAGATPAPFEYRIVRPDGAVRIVYRENEVFTDAEGRPVRVLGTMRDVTDRRAMEALRQQQEERLGTLAEQLRESQRHLSLAQQIAKVGSFERDLKTGVVLWSDETYRIMGRDPSTPPLVRDELLQTVHPDDRAAYEAGMVASEAGQVASPLDYRLILPDGRIRWIHTLATTVFDDDGRPSKRIGTTQDVTEVREAEERQRQLERSLRIAKDAAEAARREVEAANQALERRVEERTAQLRAAQQELIAKERLSTLGQLTATVAHELRNPLSAIRNTIYAIGEMAIAGGIALERPVARMDRSIRRCENIIGDLLDFTRTRELNLGRVPLDDWLGAVLDEQTLPPGIALERRLGAPGLVLRLDEDRLRRVIINLIDNAAQAIHGADGALGRIIVATAAAPEPEITVADTGPGIAPDVLARVFEPLFSTKSFGTGLGLPMVQQIVAQHGGTVAIESVVGAGTVVRVSLPCAPAEIAAA